MAKILTKISSFNDTQKSLQQLETLFNQLNKNIGITKSIQTSKIVFKDNDTSLMTSAAIANKIESYNYLTSTLSDEQVQDKVGAMFTGNTETLIAATYQDADGTIDLTVDNDLSNYDNSSSGFTTTTGTVTSVNGTGTINGLTLTGTVTSSGNLTLGGTLAINNGDWSGTALADGNIASASTWNNLVTNVSTALSVGTNNTTELSITSDGGTDDVTLPVATTSLTGVMNSAMFDKLDGIATNATANTGDIDRVKFIADSGNHTISSGDADWTVSGGEGIDTSISTSTITIAAEEASSINKGVAAFSTDNFAVSSGNVTIKDEGVATAELDNRAVTYAKMQNVTADRILGRITDTGSPTELTAANVLSLIGVTAGANPNVSGDSGNAAVYDNGGTPTLKSGITQAEMRTAIGAGTSNLALGTSGSTALAGNTTIPSLDTSGNANADLSFACGTNGDIKFGDGTTDDIAYVDVSNHEFRLKESTGYSSIKQDAGNTVITGSKTTGTGAIKFFSDGTIYHNANLGTHEFYSGGSNAAAKQAEITNSQDPTFSLLNIGTGVAGISLKTTAIGGANTFTAASGNLTLDVAGDIELNADGGNITFKDNTVNLAEISTNGILSKTVVYFDAETANTIGNGATGAIDWTVNQKQKVTITGTNITCNFTNPPGPCNLTLKVVQGDGSDVIANWDGDIKWPSGTAPTLSTGNGAIDILSFYWDGTNYFGVGSLNFS